MKRTKIIIFVIWLSLLVTILSACGSSVTSTQSVDLTATSDYSTLVYLCCTAAVPTFASTPTSLTTTNIILYRGNSQRTGVYDVPAIRNQPAIKWQTKVGTTWSMPPMLADGILYTGSGDGNLYPLNAETGEQIWSVSGLRQFESTGAIAGNKIISSGFNQLVQAFDRYDGHELWSFRSAHFMQGSPLIVNDRVYVATDHEVYALELSSGKLIWNKSTGNEGAYMGSPAYDQGVFYTTGGKLLLALDAETGNEIWRVEKEEMFLGLSVANGKIYVGNWDKYLYAFDQFTGEELLKFKADGEFWSAPGVTENTIYSGNIDKFLYALDAQTGELRWSYQTGGGAVSEPSIADGVVHVSDSTHEFPRGARHFYALDAQTGEKLWVSETISTFLPAPALGDGVIYLTSAGEVIALK